MTKKKIKAAEPLIGLLSCLCWSFYFSNMPLMFGFIGFFDYLHVLVIQSCPALCHSMDCKPTWLLCPRNSPDKRTRVSCHSLLQGIFPPGIEPDSPALQADSLLPEPPGKPHNYLERQQKK